MNCSHCGTVLPEQAKFCFQCGAAQPVGQPASAAAKQECHIVFRQIEEKWSLFGKEICRFEAVDESGTAIAVSEQFIMSGFEFYGPNERNRKQKAAFDGLVKKLLAAGWQQTGMAGTEWFAIRLQRS